MDDTTTDTVAEEPSPYLFDVSFDTDAAALAAAEAEAEKEEPPEPTFTLLQVDEARKQGFDEGVLSGREEASNGIEAHISQTLENMAQQLPAIAQAQYAANELVTANAGEIAITVMHKLMPTLLERHGIAEIDTLLAECVANLIDQPKIRVRVAADVAETVEQRLESLIASSGFDGRFLVEPDAAMKPADCCIDWPGGGMEKRTEAIWTQIDDALARFLDRYAQNNPAPVGSENESQPAPTSSANVGADDAHAAQPTADTVEHAQPTTEELSAEPAADAAAGDAAEPRPDDDASGEPGEPQSDAPPPDVETKAIDPEASA